MRPARTNRDAVFRSSFYAEAKLLGTMAEVKKRLESLPSVTIVRDGSVVRYEVIGGNGTKQVLELDRKSISFTFSFSSINAQERAANLARFLALVAMLDGLYEVHVRSIYPYVIESLRSAVIPMRVRSPDYANERRAAEMINSLEDANRVLSSLVIGAVRDRDAALGKLSLQRSFSSAIMDTLSRRGVDVSAALADEFGLGGNVADAVLKAWKEEKGGDEHAT